MRSTVSGAWLQDPRAGSTPTGYLGRIPVVDGDGAIVGDRGDMRLPTVCPGIGPYWQVVVSAQAGATAISISVANKIRIIVFLGIARQSTWRNGGHIIRMALGAW